MELRFSGSGEFCKLIIDRKNKRFRLISKMTNYQEEELPWRMLFDAGKEKEQDKATENLEDDEFKTAIILEMAAKGYKLIEDGG